MRAICCHFQKDRSRTGCLRSPTRVPRSPVPPDRRSCPFPRPFGTGSTSWTGRWCTEASRRGSTGAAWSRGQFHTGPWNWMYVTSTLPVHLSQVGRGEVVGGGEEGSNDRGKGQREVGKGKGQRAKGGRTAVRVRQGGRWVVGRWGVLEWVHSNPSRRERVNNLGIQLATTTQTSTKYFLVREGQSFFSSFDGRCASKLSNKTDRKLWWITPWRSWSREICIVALDYLFERFVLDRVAFIRQLSNPQLSIIPGLKDNAVSPRVIMRTYRSGPIEPRSMSFLIE